MNTNRRPKKEFRSQCFFFLICAMKIKTWSVYKHYSPINRHHSITFDECVRFKIHKKIDSDYFEFILRQRKRKKTHKSLNQF